MDALAFGPLAGVTQYADHFDFPPPGPPGTQFYLRLRFSDGTFSAVSGPYAVPAVPVVVPPVPAGLRASAIVLNGSGALVRTLFSAQPQAGPVTTAPAWDRTDDDGRPVPPGDYRVRVVAIDPAVTGATWEGVVGNTSADFSQRIWRAYLTHRARCEGPDGTLYTAVGYNEQQPGIFYCPPGQVQAPRKFKENNYVSQSFFVQANDTYLYEVVNNAGADKKSTCYVQRHRLDTRQPDPFPAGVTATDSLGRTVPGVTAVFASDEAAVAAQPTEADQQNAQRANWLFNRGSGLAVTNDALVVCHQGQDAVGVYDAQTGALRYTFAVPAPGGAAFAADGQLLLISAGQVRRYTIGTSAAVLNNTFTGLTDAIALDCAYASDLVIVARGGSSQNVAGYSGAGALLWSYGQAGGYPALGPAAAFDKFWFVSNDVGGQNRGIAVDNDPYGSPLTFVCCQRDGSFWVLDTAHHRSLRFSATRQYLGQVCYLPDRVRKVIVNVNNREEVFSGLEEFRVPDAPLQPGDQSLSATPSWSFVNNWGVGLDQLRYGVLYSVWTGPNGRRYGLLNDSNTGTSNPGLGQLVELVAGVGLRFIAQDVPETDYDYGGGIYESEVRADGSILQLRINGQVAGQPAAYQGGPYELTLAVKTPAPYAGNDPQWGPFADYAVWRSNGNSTEPIPLDPGGTRYSIQRLTNGRTVVYRPNPVLDRTGVYHVGLVGPGSAGYVAQFQRGISGTTNDGLGHFVETQAYGGLAGCTVRTDGEFVYPYYNGQNNAAANQGDLFTGDGAFLFNYGTHSLTDDYERDTDARAGYAGNGLDFCVAPRPAGAATGYAYLVDESEHAGLHRWRFFGLNAIVTRDFTVTVGPAPVVVVVGGGPPNGSPTAYGFAEADPTVGRINTANMTVLNVGNANDLRNALAANLTNTAIRLQDGDYVGYFEQTGTQDNVVLESLSGNARLLNPDGSTNLLFQGGAVRNRIAVRGLQLLSNATGSGYPQLWANELPRINGLEFAHLDISGPHGAFNAVGLVRYSTASNSGQVLQNFWVHHNNIHDVGRCGMELLSQGYDGVFRLLNFSIEDNVFRNLGLGDPYGMAISCSGLFKGGGIHRNAADGTRRIGYELVNAQQVIARGNNLTGSKDGVGWGFSDDQRGFTADLFVEGGVITAAERPFYLADCKRIHLDGQNQLWQSQGKGAGANNGSTISNSADCVLKNLNILTRHTQLETGFTVDGGTTGLAMNECTISSAGAFAVGKLPANESLVIRQGATNNSLVGVTTVLGQNGNGQTLKGNADATSGGNGAIVNYGGPTNTLTNNAFSTAP